MIVAHFKTIFGIAGPKLTTTTPGNQGTRIATTVGAGNRFWAWPSISPAPTTLLTGIDFDPVGGPEYSWGYGAPTASADANVNLAILAELATSGPTTASVLTFA